MNLFNEAVVLFLDSSDILQSSEFGSGGAAWGSGGGGLDHSGGTFKELHGDLASLLGG